MRQMLLDWGLNQPQTLDTFVPGRNEELAQVLRAIRTATSVPQERFIYIWGEHGAGKTHLLKALATQANARYIASDADADAFLFSDNVSLYLLDDCDNLSPESQIAAFALFNQVRENNAALITAGSVAPAFLSVREDLRTRLGWGLIYQVHGLSDEEKIAALTRAAQSRGLALSPGVLPYLITHFHRDMRSLAAMLDALDRYSLETKRPITLPLLRELLELEEPPRT
ncbi:MAG: DnaA regulatory inactivator Hda [Burkholderiaceae bacterium]